MDSPRGCRETKTLRPRSHSLQHVKEKIEHANATKIPKIKKFSSDKIRQPPASFFLRTQRPMSSDSRRMICHWANRSCELFSEFPCSTASSLCVLSSFLQNTRNRLKPFLLSFRHWQSGILRAGGRSWRLDQPQPPRERLFSQANHPASRWLLFAAFSRRPSGFRVLPPSTRQPPQNFLLSFRHG